MPKYHVTGDGSTTAPPEAEKDAREAGLVGTGGGVHNPSLEKDLRAQANADAHDKGKPEPLDENGHWKNKRSW